MKQLGEVMVNDYMSHQAICVDDSNRLTQAIRIMDDDELTVLPVVNNQGVLVGILSASDLIEITHEIQADLNALTTSRKKPVTF